MLLCWSIDAAERPKFSGLVTTLSVLLERDAGYLELSSNNTSEPPSQSFDLKNKSAPSESGPEPTLPTVQEVETVDIEPDQ